MANPGSGGHAGNGHSNGHAGNGHAGHGGHGGVQFERTDITTGGLYVFALVLGVIVIGAAGGMSLLYDYLRKEADRQNRNLPTLVEKAAADRKPGDKLPFNGDENKPLLEGIRGTDPSAPRSGVYGYPTLSEALKKSAAEKLSTYGYLDKGHTFAHVPIEVAIDELTTSKMLKVREKSPDGVEIGSLVNPYSFYRSDSSSGRSSLGETRK